MQRLGIVNFEIHEKIMGRLQELGYIDDNAFVRTYVENMTRNHPMGKRMFVQKLRQKGVDKEIIHQVLSDQTNDGIDEMADARKAIGKKMIIWQKLPVMACKRKVYSYLLRRGFGGSIAGKIIDEVFGKGYNRSTEEV